VIATDRFNPIRKILGETSSTGEAGPSASHGEGDGRAWTVRELLDGDGLAE
jgi:hypothetical protein